jgi:hypothetical protein
MSSWIRLECRCGARWNWYGRASEARLLERLWRQAHLGGHHVVSVCQNWGEAA